jgi:hypothetical protein
MTVTNDVPIFEPVLEKSERFVKEVLESLGDEVWNTNVDPVENKSRDGFIPFTQGGFDGIGYSDLRYCWSSGNVPKVIQPYIDESLKDCKKWWDEENPDHPYEWIFDNEADDNERKQMDLAFIEGYHPTKREIWREKYYDYEDESLSEGSTFFYKVRVLFFDEGNHRNVSGEPEAYFMAMINTDFEYGRDNISWAGGNQNECFWEKTVPISEITDELIDQFIQEASDALLTA